MQIKTLAWYSLFAVIISMLCIVYVDYPLAVWIEAYLRQGVVADYTNNMSSNLLKLVVVVTVISTLAYTYLRIIKSESKHRDFFLLLAITLPLSYVLKTGLKYIFARVETRLWLAHQDMPLPHWFHYEGFGFNGFPSGHMLVLTILFLALWRFYSRFNAIYLVGWLSLAAALLITNYHFLSDVIIGTMIGFWLYLVMEKLLTGKTAINKTER